MHVYIYIHTHLPPDEIPNFHWLFLASFSSNAYADFRASFWERSAGIAGMSRMSRMSCDDGIFHVKIPGKWRLN